jgi:hypothetical protein
VQTFPQSGWAGNVADWRLYAFQNSQYILDAQGLRYTALFECGKATDHGYFIALENHQCLSDGDKGKCDGFPGGVILRH